jgi:threonine/homoserine/homoserine lactone efflux protein|tara:strand:- start:171 stop:761 length:591 start_codon:yes stop_codon:yes gene_type:complete
MHPELFSLIIFCLVTSCTPGPNNILASYSGFNFGVKKTFPLMAGVAFGYTLMLTTVNFGLIIIFKNYPIIQEIIKVIGSIFLIYLAYKISFSKNRTNIIQSNPVKFFDTFLFQFINPKAIIVATIMISTFVDSNLNYLKESFWVIGVNFIFAWFSITFWTLLGKFLRKFATNEKFIKIFNYVMSFLLISCIATFYL